MTTRHRPRVGRLATVRRSALSLLLSGLTFAASAACPAQSLPPIHAATADPYAAHIAMASQRFGIPPAWISAVKRAESGGDVRAVSPAGALGLMQIMPDTWADLRDRYRLGRDPFDPRDNIIAGTAYLREMFDRYGTVPAMLAAYNAGPARYEEHLATGRALPAETRAYVAALAPIMLGERPVVSAPVAPPPLDWREASIFVVRAIGVATADLMPSVHSAADVLPSVPAILKPPPAPQPQGLFVAGGADGERP